MSEVDKAPLNSSSNAKDDDARDEKENGTLARIIKWGIVVGSALIISFIPVPEGITPQSWRLLAIFFATIIGSILRPVPSGAVVLMGVAAIALTGTMTVNEALRGYADPIVWLVLAAFFISRGMGKTGLGRRIALLFVRGMGKHSLGLGYALASTDMLLASVIPSTGARSGGIIFPIARSIAETYDSKPGPTARRLGAFLMVLLYQCDVIVCATFLTGQASNILIAKFAKAATGIELSYTRWLLCSILPALASFLVVPVLLYRIFPPQIKHTPDAARFAAEELKRMGSMRLPEKMMLVVFGLVAALWIIGDKLPLLTGGRLQEIHYAVVALVGICVLLLFNVLDWKDVLSERSAWDVFIWYGGLVRMAEALGETGLTKRFAEVAASMTTTWKWSAALMILLLIYFYAHYGFASITAHATAMYTPFLVVVIAAGAPPMLAVLSLAFLSNLSASLTHYGTTPAPIWFGANYVRQRTWWLLGLIVSVPNILIWVGIGFLWWKILGWW